jgi:hypothetical protein
VTCADFNFDNYSLITYDFFKDLNEDIKEEPTSPESETCNAGMDSDISLFRNSHSLVSICFSTYIKYSLQ